MPFVQVGDENIYYARRGVRGIPVVFIHGAGGSHLIWGQQIRALGEIARAVALDLPGHNKSGPRGRRSIEAYRDVVLRFFDALGFTRAVIIGHSMGGAIAQALALSHPDRVAGLGLVGTGARLRVLPKILDGLLNDYDQTARWIVQLHFAPNPDPALRLRSEEQLRACPPQVVHDDYAACNDFDVMARVPEIRAPTLVLCGHQDRLAPVKYPEFLASKIPHARLVLIEGAGHLVMLEKPEEVNRALDEWVRTLPA